MGKSWNGTIYVDAEFSIDLLEYLEDYENIELIDELRKRGFTIDKIEDEDKIERRKSIDVTLDDEVEIELDEYVGEFSDDVLKEELEYRGYSVYDESEQEELESTNLSSNYKIKDTLKRQLCDLVDSNYHISNDELLNKLKEIL